MGTLSIARTTASRIPFIFVLLIVAGWFWLFGDAYFPDWSYGGLSYATTISYYIALLVIFLIFSKIRALPILGTPSNIAFRQFAIGAIATLIFMMFALSAGFVGQNQLAAGMFIPMIIMQVAIVAPAEELMFRGVLQSYVGIIAQAVVFAFWHSVTYGAIWSKYGWPPMTAMYALFIAFAFGIAMGLVARHKDLGIPACIGAHAMFNLVVLGALL